MGAGASNLSTSDLSVYQSALAKISQNLSNTTSNVSSISLNSKQTVKFRNGGMVGCDDATVFRSKLKYIDMCQHGRTDQTYPPSSPDSGKTVEIDGGCDFFAKVGLMNSTERAQCYQDCQKQANELFTSCTPEEKIASTPTINCSIGIYQTSNQNATTTQAADNFLDASMASNITNRFESEIDKTISQSNKDLNFMQSNTSDERTALSQSIKNDVSNAIAQSAQNISSTFQNNEQIVDFENEGIINCDGCGSKPETASKLMATETFPSGVQNGRCTLIIDQNNLQSAGVNQKASAALRSIFDNTLANELASKYSLEVDQKNTGVNLAELLLTLLLPLIFLLLFVPLCLWAGSRVVGSMSGFFTQIGWALGIVLIIGVVTFVIMLFTCGIPSIYKPNNGSCPAEPTPTPTSTATPTATPTPTPTPTATPQPQSNLCPAGTTCTYSNYNTCFQAATAYNSKNNTTTSCRYNYNNNGLYCGPCN
jgi:hypothetical protein